MGYSTVGNGTYSTQLGPGTFTFVFSANGLTWNGALADPFFGGLSCTGTATGNSFTGSCDGVYSLSGTMFCQQQILGIALTGPDPLVGTGSASASGPDLHENLKTYTWNTTSGGITPNGTAFTDFLGALNAGASDDGTATTGYFADHCDWRLPTMEELSTLLNPGLGQCAFGSGPCIDESVFGPASDLYWSGTTINLEPHRAFLLVSFDLDPERDTKDTDYSARAVRARF